MIHKEDCCCPCCQIPRLEKTIAEQAEQIADMVMLIRRLAARLPETSDIRHKAHDYLKRNGFQSHVLREAATPQKGE